MKQNRIKVVYFGTPEFACLPLQSLILDHDLNVLTVVTQEDKPVGRKQVLTSPPVKIIAENNGIPVLQPKSIRNNQEFINLLKGLKADFFVVAAYGNILPHAILEIPKYACINLHGSLLPKYRGASPIEEALLNGDPDTGITFMKMAEGLDSGDIYYMQRIKIERTDDSQSLRAKLSSLGATHLPHILKDIREEILSPIPQDNSKATFCHKIKKEDGLIDFKLLTAEEIFNRMRAYTPWPNCFFKFNGKTVKILSAEVYNLSENKQEKPGEAVLLAGGNIAFCTKKGLLVLKKIQIEGKNPVSVQDFLRGNASFFI
jgi:methionyl-tRNA formyltransferase